MFRSDSDFSSRSPSPERHSVSTPRKRDEFRLDKEQNNAISAQYYQLYSQLEAATKPKHYNKNNLRKHNFFNLHFSSPLFINESQLKELASFLSKLKHEELTDLFKLLQAFSNQTAYPDTVKCLMQSIVNTNGFAKKYAFDLIEKLKQDFSQQTVSFIRQSTLFSLQVLSKYLTHDDIRVFIKPIRQEITPLNLTTIDVNMLQGQQEELREWMKEIFLTLNCLHPKLSQQAKRQCADSIFTALIDSHSSGRQLYITFSKTIALFLESLSEEKKNVLTEKIHKWFSTEEDTVITSNRRKP